MSGRVAVVYFFMVGCPHCEAMRPAWNDAKKQLKHVKVEEKEANQVGMDDGVQSFPTIVVRKNGKEVKRLEGKRNSGKEIIQELGIRRRRGGTHRRKGKSRHRTLRNYKSFA
jgi:thiol-disulfide isomerase/thioredoxin